MRIHELPISYYIGKINRNEHFSVAGYSDAEFFCMMGIREGCLTGLGQVIDVEHGKRLLNVLYRRQKDPRFLFAIPKCLWGMCQFAGSRIDAFLEEHGVLIEACERDMVTDDLARHAGLHSFINCLKNKRIAIIGPKELRGLTFLDYDYFVEIPTPNLHLEPHFLNNVIVNPIFNTDRLDVCLVSAGVSAAVIIDQLSLFAPHVSFIDCGSIWDCFVGIGGQRQWRADLYENPKRWERWKNANINGTTY